MGLGRIDMSHKTRHGYGGNNLYRKQHVIPRFIITNFTDANHSAWIHNGQGFVVYNNGASSRYYWEERLYGGILDASWTGYEGGASACISSISAGANALSASYVWAFLHPYIAGLVARDRYVHVELSISDWWDDVHMLSNDDSRALVFNAMLTALIPARISIMRTYRNIILNDCGYAFDEDEERMLVPLSPHTLLIVTWGDEVNHNPVFVKNQGDLSFSTTNKDPFIINDITARQANTITSQTQEDADMHAPGFSPTGLVRWISTWLPKSSVWSWIYPLAMSITADPDYPIHHFADTVEGSANMITSVFSTFSRQSTWRPPVMVMPNRDETRLYNAVHNDGGRTIFDIADAPNPSLMNWVGTEYEVPGRIIRSRR